MSATPGDKASNPSWLADLFSSSSYSDLIIRCGGRDFHVHRAVICMQSQFFQAACKEGFREAEEGVINLEEDDPAVVEGMLQFLYVGNYDPSGLTSLSNLSPVEFSARLYCIGDKYQIEPLKAFVQKDFVMLAKESINDVAFKNVVSYVYANTVPQDRRLRSALVWVTVDHFASVFNGHGEELKSLQEFMFDLSVSLVKANSSRSMQITVLKKQMERERAAHRVLAKYRCATCSMQFTMTSRLGIEMRCPRRGCPRLSIQEVDESEQGPDGT